MSTLLLVGGVALLAAALVPGGITTVPATAAAATVVPATTEVVVLPGDTLWSLADEVAGPGEDVRDVVLRIEQLNELVSADVAIGDRLRVPA